MNIFYGSASYLWLMLAVFCTVEQHGDWGLLWISLFVGAYVIVGKAVIFMVKLMWDMEHNPAKFNQIMNYYLAYMLEEQNVRTYLNGK